jgi:CubicO group peptidase (beta-lactamase class C family)
MREALIAAAILTLAGVAASAAPSPPVKWVPDDPMDGGNDRISTFKVRVVARGDHIRGLPIAAHQIEPRWTWGGRGWTLDQYMSAYNVSGVMVLKDGQVVLERYAHGRQPSDRWVSQSVGKSVTSLLAGAAIQDGRLKLTDTVGKFAPELKGSAYEAVTVRQLLTMSSGVKWAEGYDFAGGSSDLQKYYASALSGRDQYAGFMGGLPRVAPAGSTFHYNTAETHLAGLVVARAVGKPLAEYLSQKIWRPYGMARDAAWQVDPRGREFAGCCLFMTLGDYARLGQFALDDGVIDGRRVLPRGWIAESTRVQIDNGRPPPQGYGYFWWITGPDRFQASGIYGQMIVVYPKDRVVIAVNSLWARPDDDADFDALHAFEQAARTAAAGALASGPAFR